MFVFIKNIPPVPPPLFFLLFSLVGFLSMSGGRKWSRGASECLFKGVYVYIRYSVHRIVYTPSRSFNNITNFYYDYVKRTWEVHFCCPSCVRVFNGFFASLFCDTMRCVCVNHSRLRTIMVYDICAITTTARTRNGRGVKCNNPITRSLRRQQRLWRCFWLLTWVGWVKREMRSGVALHTRG